MNKFKNGRECVQDAHLAGRTAQEFVKSVNSVHTIMCNHLKMRKISAWWMPHHLTWDQTEHCLEVATHLLSQFDSEGQDFFKNCCN